MRVISGTARGSKLYMLEVEHLRPMLDRVREALFNIIRAEVEGAKVLDLFSGCGALGIEALSRGAIHCAFVEKDPKLARLVGRNLAKCRMQDRATVLARDVLALSGLHAPHGACPATVVFVDPPYAMVDDPNARAELFRALESMIGRWIGQGALLALHHAPTRRAQWPGGSLECFDRRVYGHSQISLFDVKETAEHGRQ